MRASKSILLVLIVLCLSAVCFGQSAATGDLHVIVKDAKGSVITNATVTLTRRRKGFQRSTTSNTDGEYNVLALPPRVYAVTVEAPGFAKAAIQEVKVTVGQLRSCRLNWQSPEPRKTINVNAEAELIETERTSSTNTSNSGELKIFPSTAATTSTSL
jgi:hypothetical protein